MSQSRRIQSHSDGAELTFRIVGRKKKYEVSKILGETRLQLDERIAKAINSHSRSLRNPSVHVEAGDVRYVRVMVSGKNKGSDVTVIDETLW